MSVTELTLHHDADVPVIPVDHDHHGLDTAVAIGHQALEVLGTAAPAHNTIVGVCKIINLVLRNDGVEQFSESIAKIDDIGLNVLGFVADIVSIGEAARKVDRARRYGSAFDVADTILGLLRTLLRETTTGMSIGATVNYLVTSGVRALTTGIVLTLVRAVLALVGGVVRLLRAVVHMIQLSQTLHRISHVTDEASLKRALRFFEQNSHKSGVKPTCPEHALFLEEKRKAALERQFGAAAKMLFAEDIHKKTPCQMVAELLAQEHKDAVRVGINWTREVREKILKHMKEEIIPILMGVIAITLASLLLAFIACPPVLIALSVALGVLGLTMGVLSLVKARQVTDNQKQWIDHIVAKALSHTSNFDKQGARQWVQAHRSSIGYHNLLTQLRASGDKQVEGLKKLFARLENSDAFVPQLLGNKRLVKDAVADIPREISHEYRRRAGASLVELRPIGAAAPLPAS